MGNFPHLEGPPAPELCRKEAAPDFFTSRDRLSIDQKNKVQSIIASFDEMVSMSGDVEFHRTPIGTCHARHIDGCYVLFQRFKGTERHQHQIKLWYCGAVDHDGDRHRYDFED